MTLPSYAVDFRGRPACPCQAAWLPAFEQHLKFRGILGASDELPIAQLIGGFSGSGGTHGVLDSSGNFIGGGGASDFWFVGPIADQVVWVARQMGADASWHRLAGWDGPGSDEHDHCVLRDCPHLSPSARAQISAVDGNGDGLGGTTTPDPGPRPLSGRTWREGIAWAREQEDDMVDPKVQEQLDRIEQAATEGRNKVFGLASAEAERAKANRKRDAAIADGLDKLATQIPTRAGKAQVAELKTLLLEHDTEETP